VSATGLAALAAFAADRSVPGAAVPVIAKARACLLYGLSVAIAGHAAPEPAIAVRSQEDEPPDPGGATRLLDGGSRSPESAAFANAVLMHARVQEDAHPAGHVGVVVLPAALACAQRLQAGGDALLAAIAIGYEVALRIGRDHCAGLSERGFRTTSAYGPFGAAAACARLRGLNASQTMHALALAASAAGGMRAFVEAGSQDYAFQAGLATRGGMRCASLAAAGATGAASALDGPAGFFRAFGGIGSDHGRRIPDGLGESWEFDRVAFKPYPVCQFHRAVVAGVLALRERANGSPAAGIEVHMHPFEAGFFGVRHAGAFASFAQSFMSAPFCASLAWLRGEVTYRGMNDFAAGDVLDLVGRVRVVADPACPRYQPRIRILLEAGGTLEWNDPAGEEGYRLDWTQAQRMCRRLLDEAGVSTGSAEALISAAAAMEGPTGVARLMTAAVAACADVRAPIRR
jgi:2-methylcitrate dehydratase PrpD